ncbi:MAG TPA: hypothetical protein VFA18_05550, partial [Gemmataceae bacterium]|nr:hypothetical protein [Gemmataceae bacterium]
APVRAQAWQAIRQLGGQLWQRTHDEETGQRVAGPAGAGSVSAATWDATRTRRRARVAVGLLKLAGTSGMADVDQALAQAEAAPSNAAWQSFEQQLRSALDRVRAEQPQHSQDRRAACRKSRQDLWRWLGKHYQAERDAFPADSKYRSYFNDAAEDYLREP